MSTLFWALGIPLAYVVMGVGTARVVLAHRMRVMTKVRGGFSPNIDHEDVVLPALLFGVFWPAWFVWALLLRPLVTVVGPGLGAWFTAPARRVEREATKARTESW